jgi:hypothetical protein
MKHTRAVLHACGLSHHSCGAAHRRCATNHWQRFEAERKAELAYLKAEAPAG